MPQKKFLNKEDKKKPDAEDEWAHLAGVDDGSKIKAADAMDVQDRNIFIRDKKRKPTSTSEIVSDAISETSHKTRTTDQYVRLVNAILDERLLELEKAKQKNNLFEEELHALNPDSDTTLPDLEKISINDLKSTEVAKLIKAIAEEKESTVSKLTHYQNQASTLERDLGEQEKKINELNKHLQDKKEQEVEVKEKESEDAIDEELKILKDLYGGDKLAKALKKLKETEK